MGRVAILERVGGVAGPVWCTAIGAGKKRFLGLWGSNIAVLPAHGAVIPCTAGLMPPGNGWHGCAACLRDSNTGTTAGLMPPERWHG